MTNPAVRGFSATLLIALALFQAGCFGPWRRHERREERRDDRYDHREERRDDRYDHRDERRDDRRERWD
jgi:hypothetical protein